jgi:hypothetical protein
MYNEPNILVESFCTQLLVINVRIADVVCDLMVDQYNANQLEIVVQKCDFVLFKLSVL